MLILFESSLVISFQTAVVFHLSSTDLTHVVPLIPYPTHLQQHLATTVCNTTVGDGLLRQTGPSFYTTLHSKDTQYFFAKSSPRNRRHEILDANLSIGSGTSQFELSLLVWRTSLTTCCTPFMPIIARYTHTFSPPCN